MTVSLTPQAFVAKWQQAELRERAASQEHFIDLCRLLAHPTPAEVDPDGTWFTFEKGAAKATGGDGWADVWKRGCFGWEYKGKHGDLDRAYGQLLLYQGALENPPLLIVSDIATIRIHTHFTNTVRVTHTLALEDLLDPAKLDMLRKAFTEPDALRSPETTTQVTERAAGQFARIAQLLRRYGHDPHQVAHFLIRLLFCLFAEDTGILPRGMFTRLVQQPRRNASTFASQLQQLFSAMAAGGFFGADAIAHVDGGLFDDDTALPMDSESLRILAEVSGQDWAAIEPAILGTLFERGLDPDKRSQLGAHFTAKEDILLIVEPVLLAPLRRRWEAVQAEAAKLAARRDASRGKARANAERELFGLLRGFRAELAAVQVLDAACGSGNFLYVALRRLLDLEKEVISLAVSLGDSFSLPLVMPAQLHGIEVNPYAYELAQATIWIGYIQWLRENGFGLPEEPILKPLDAIRQMDAILAYDAAGRPVEPEWPAADVIIGNPPFLGGGKIRRELGDKYTDDLFRLYGDRLPNFSDLVCYWFEKARAQIEAGQTQRAGLLATQAIRGGANRKVLERIKETGDIFWAYADRNWVLDGATVHVSMVGFDGGEESHRELNGQRVTVINAALTSSVDLTQAKSLNENRAICFVGPSPKAPFDIDQVLGRSIIDAPTNINGRSNRDVVKPVVSGIDIVQGSRDRYTIDFGLLGIEEASQYEAPFRYVEEVVRKAREKRRDDYRGQWWQYARPRPEMRAALVGKTRFIATPRIAKHRVFVWLSDDVLPNDQTVVFARDDDYFLGVLHSRPHELWARATGTQLREAESGFRYTPTTTFETFPFPWPPGHEPAGDPRVEAIAAAAADLVAKRDAWLNPPDASADELKRRTLTNLYNQRPTWLALAHRRLDEAVLDAYGWPHDITDEELLARLLSLNAERALNGARAEASVGARPAISNGRERTDTP